MSVRKETIILEMEDHASAKALQAAGGLKTLDTVLDSLDGHAATVGRRFTTLTKRADGLTGSLGKANASLGATNASLDAMGSVGLVRFTKQTDIAVNSIDRFSGRAALMGASIAAIGPGAIPIAATAVPALVSLVAGMGAAAGAAGVLTLAFNGIGDAVTAVSEYRLTPTAENLAKVRQEMERLGPAGADFVMAIDAATPALRDLQQTARAGIFPGFERALDTFMTQLPGVRDMVADLSLTVGNLGEASADALVNDSDWQEFFDHLGTDGASALDAFGRATGNVVAGAANLVEALTDITGDSSGLVESSRAFREWADNLEHTEGFQEFADYVRESGPQVAEFLGATGEAMVGVAEAAAPWGQVVLPVLTTLAEVTGAIASSPLGPPLFAAAAAMLVFNKAAAASSAIMGRVTPAYDKARTSLSQMRTDLGTVAGGWVLASSATERESKKMAAAQARLKAVAAEAARTGPALAAMGLLATGSADKMGLTNTAVLTLAGSMAGPWGAAAGAAVGVTMDLAAANDDLATAIKSADQAMAAGNIEQMTASVKALQAALAETSDADILGVDLGDGFGQRIAEISNFAAPLSNVKNLMGQLTGETDKATKKLDEVKATKAGFEDLAVALGANRDSAAEMASGADRAQIAMDKLGISTADMAAAQQEGGAAWSAMQSKIAAYVALSDTAAGRTEAFGDALANMGNDALGAAENADALTSALSAILDPMQGLIAAQDGMSSALNGLKGEIDATNKSLVGNSDAAIQNRAAISASVDRIQDLNAAQAAAGTSTIEMATTLGQNRQALIDQGVAAGLSRAQVERLVNQMGLTPDVVRTAFQAAGIEEVDAKTVGLTNRFLALPKRVQTDIATNGIPKSEADIQRLQAKYKLTPKQVQTLARLMDNASGPIAAVIAALRAADGQSATTTITTRRITEIITISSGQSTRPDRRIEPGQMADGGTVPGQRHPYGDKTLILAAPGEEVITNRNGEADRYRADRAAGRIPAYADGGTVGIFPGYAKGGRVKPRRGWEDGPVYTALWQAARRDPSASLIANMTAKQLVRLGKEFDNISSKSLARFGRSIDRATNMKNKELDAAKKQVDFWVDKRNELNSAVSGSLTLDWFGGGSSDPWSGAAQPGTVAYANAQWTKQAGDSDRLKKTIANLKKNGATDAFIAEILRSPDPLAAATMFNQQGKAGMLASQKLFLSASRATSSAASYTSNAVYGDDVARSRREVSDIRADLKRLLALEKKNHKEAQDSRNRNSPRKAAAKGSRSRKR